MSAQDMDVGAALPKTPRDFVPLLLPIALALVALPFIPSTSTWITLTIAGLAMGMMIFVMASGLTLIFGLMDVLNVGHGAFIAIGAYMATLVLVPLAAWMQADSVWLNLAAVVPAVLFAMAVTGATMVGFAGHCYGARLAVDAAIALPEAAGVVAAHYAPPVAAKDVSATRRWRYRIRRWRPIAWLSGTAFGRRVLEPIVTRVFGGSRTIEGRNEILARGLSDLLGRADVIFVSGDDEARYHLRLRPFLDRFVPTLPPERAARLESVLSPVEELGGYMSLEGQRTEIELIVDRIVRLAGAAGVLPSSAQADDEVRLATGPDGG